jgi:hypothetical protein
VIQKSLDNLSHKILLSIGFWRAKYDKFTTLLYGWRNQFNLRG